MSDTRTIWLTGMSGVGKSTIARRLQSLLRDQGKTVVIVDGDQVRDAVADTSCGHNREDRIKNAYRICRIAKMIADQSVSVIVATMSLYHEVHAWNRENLPGYVEVHLTASLDTLRGRDPKGLYRRVTEGDEQNLSGVDIAAEFPLEPHLRIDNDENCSDVTCVAEKIVNHAWS